MKKGLLILLTTLSVLAVSCNNSGNKRANVADTTANKATTAVTTQPQTESNMAGTDEYTVNVPQGWEQKEQQMKSYKMLLLAAPREGNYQPNMTVLKDDMHGNTIDAYIEANLKQMAPMHIRLNKTGDLEIDGIKGRYMTYTYNYEGRDIAIKSYILPKNNVAYILTGSSLVSQSGKMMPEFDKTADTFKLKN